MLEAVLRAGGCPVSPVCRDCPVYCVCRRLPADWRPPCLLEAVMRAGGCPVSPVSRRLPGVPGLLEAALFARAALQAGGCPTGWRLPCMHEAAAVCPDA
eukprot:359692-Chlamydomonas_euryale.AAC.2